MQLIDNPGRDFYCKIGMRVLLAGFNVDKEVLDDLQRRAGPRLDMTPETLSASYARISRDPRPVDELRAAARKEVEKARRSNENIIFKMGHHSVAEHAVFNFDLLGISRLALEEVERFRLCSYTEKSQRYITLGDDFVVPEEIRKAGMENLFLRTIRAQNALYHRLYDKLRPHFFRRYSDLSLNSRNHSVLDGWAKEDARYVVSLATESQVGLTLNARNLEFMIRRLASSPLAELRELREKMHDLVKSVAPSIILFTGATEFDRRMREEFTAAAANFPRREGGPSDGLQAGGEALPSQSGEEPVRLVDRTSEGDDRILAALLHSSTGRTYAGCLADVRRAAADEKRELFRALFRHMEFYDFPPREFEYAELTFALLVSASAFAQLKRHRLATLTAQAYDPALGVTRPHSIDEVDAGREFDEIIALTEETYAELRQAVGPAAAYVLTNAHRRRVLFKLNIRELYHVSRLRQDPSAQWDIREIVNRMAALAREVMPLSCLLLGGKDRYPVLYEELYGRRPLYSPPESLRKNRSSDEPGGDSGPGFLKPLF